MEPFKYHVYVCKQVKMEGVPSCPAKGSEKVLVTACHEGNCRSMAGTKLVNIRIKRARRDTGLSESDLRFHAVAANESVKMLQVINDIRK